MKTQNNNTNTANTANTTSRTYETLTDERKREVIAEVLAEVHTCKQASTHYARLADLYGPTVAKSVLGAIKAQVKARVQAVTDDAKSVRARLSDGEKVAQDAWNGLLRDESTQGRMWARAVYESAGCSLEDMVLRYADYVVEVDGEVALCARRTTRKNPVTGERESGYAPLSATVAGWMSALKTAVKNAKKAALGASRSDYQRTVTLTWGLDA